MTKQNANHKADQATLIIGANSEIAKALATIFVESNTTQLIVVSRNIEFYQQDAFAQTAIIHIKHYDELEIANTVDQIKQRTMNYNITQVFICHGLLHSKNCYPEKRLEDFSANAFNQVMSANAITPMLWLKYLAPLLAGRVACKVVAFSARVGSIGDNKLGGWYSYRASKSALNMLLQSAVVELNRRAKNIKLISFHPGTTDSPLSKPFQKNVPEGKLFTSQFVAKQLLLITEKAEFDSRLSYVDWQGKTIPW